MESEGSTSAQPESSLNRREFFKFAPAVLIAGYLGVKQALKTPEFDINDPIESSALTMSDLSFVERSASAPRPPFISINKGGHRDYLRHIVSETPIIQEAIVSGYNEMLSRDPERFTFEMAIDTHLTSIYESLSQSRDFNKLPDYYKVHQCLSYATYSMAIQFSTWFRMQELREMGVDFPGKFLEPDEYDVAPDKMLWKLLPGIFPTAFDETIKVGSYAHLLLASGSDRAVHFMNHFFIGSRFLSLLEAGNQDAKRIPNGLNMAITGLSPYDKVMRISNLAGYAWEFKEILDSPYTNGDEQVPQGIHDPVVELDYKANQLGAMFAISLHKYLKVNREKKFNELMRDIVNIFKMLDSPAYTTPDRILFRNLKTGKYYTSPLLVP